MARVLFVLVFALGCTAAAGGGAAPGTTGPVGGKADVFGPPESRVELKVLVDPASIDDALAMLELDARDAREAYVSFYDAPGLPLFEEGVVLRARKIIDDDDDTTVKIRPLTAAEAWAIVPELFDVDGFKCEIDRTLDGEVSSCSLTSTQDRGEIDAVADGERDLDKLFDSAQEAFFAMFAPDGLGFEDATPHGPVPTLRWELRPEALPGKLTIELWEMPDGEALLELSLKSAAGEADETFEALLAYVESLDLPLAETQGTKTRRVLEGY